MSNRKMVAVLALSAFIGMTAIVSFDLLMPSVAADLDTSVAAIAQITTVMYVAGALVGLSLGPVADHYGLRRTMMLAGVLLTASNIATALSTEYWMLLLSRLPVGFGIMGAVSVAIAATRLPEDERRTGIGWISSLIPLAAILGSPLLGMIAHHTSWRVSYLVLASVFALVTWLIGRYVPADPSWPATRFNAAQALVAYRPILRHSTMLLLYLVDILRTAATWSIWIFLSSFLVQVHGLSLQQVSVVYTSIGVAYVVGTRFGNGSFRWLSLPALAGSTSLAMAPFSFIVLTGGLNLTITIMFLLIYTFMAGVGFPALTIMITETTRGGQGTTMMLRRSLFAGGKPSQRVSVERCWRWGDSLRWATALWCFCC
jgi:predicted MFS family arabinose efflux permease